MKNYRIGIIGGSGVYTLRDYDIFAKNRDSHFDPAGGLLTERYRLESHEVYFTPRHGVGHILLPHEINYVNLIKSFVDAQIDFIVSFCTVGSLDVRFQPGDYIIPENVIDFTQNRIGSKYVLDNKHIDMRPLFNKSLNILMQRSFAAATLPITNGGTLGVIEGPRFSTSAEQRMFKLMGCDFLNMTQMPEMYLAHVFSVPYISLCHVTDLTASVDKVYDIKSHSAIEVFKSNVGKVENILTYMFKELNRDNSWILEKEESSTAFV